MIKLEDLKMGDVIYGVTPDGLGLFTDCTVTKELMLLDLYPNPTEAVLCKGGVEILSRYYENYFFRTQKEAVEKLSEIRFKSANELLKSDKFIDRLFECATSSKRLDRYTEVPIYELAIKLHKQTR